MSSVDVHSVSTPTSKATSPIGELVSRQSRESLRGSIELSYAVSYSGVDAIDSSSNVDLLRDQLDLSIAGFWLINQVKHSIEQRMNNK
jgi:hypothetical protein